MYNWTNLQVCFNNHVNLHILFILHSFFSFFFFLCISRVNEKKWMMVIIHEEKETIKNIDILMKYCVNR